MKTIGAYSAIFSAIVALAATGCASAGARAVQDHGGAAPEPASSLPADEPLGGTPHGEAPTCVLKPDTDECVEAPQPGT